MPEGNPIPFEFPGKGIDVTREYQLQPPGTTPDALNVRSRDSIAQRNRGGSRPGYSPYIPQLIPAGVKLIQHLNFIVDPTVDALPQNFITPGDDWIPDPRFGISVPPGGAPWQLNPNAPPPPDSISYRQSAQNSGEANTLPSNTLTVTLPSSVPANDMVLVAVVTEQSNTVTDPCDPGSGIGDQNVVVAVKDGAGNSYTHIGSYAIVNTEDLACDQGSSGITYHRLSIWRHTSAGLANDKIVTVKPNPPSLTPPDSIAIWAAALVYHNIDTISPVVDSGFNTVAAVTAGGLVSTLAVGSVTTANEGMTLAILGSDGTVQPTTVPATFHFRRQSPSTIWAFDFYPDTAGTASTTFNLSSPTFMLAMAVVTFKKAP